MILCEDQQQEVFIRHFLMKKGYTQRQMRIERCPSGKQAGEQFVREKYPAELKALRQRTAKAETALLVMIDADTGTVTEMAKRLDAICSEQGVAVRNQNDRAVLLIPRRNIETWVHFLDGEAVDETTAYSKLRYESDCKLGVKGLFEICSEGECPADFPDSLKVACLEYQRVK
ncbi:MAG: hypothetical protein H7Y05_15075 [Steroidobacteraceae bacterium]|nr:hypothetical protein [Deltaproteobacteria bacterium]